MESFNDSVAELYPNTHGCILPLWGSRIASFERYTHLLLAASCPLLIHLLKTIRSP